MRPWTRRMVASLVPLTLLFAGTAYAKINTERGNIVSTDWNRMQMEIRSPNGRSKTWNVARDCEVKFTDKKNEFPNPRIADLEAPMYIHFMFQEGTDVIESIDVVEVGFEPSAGGAGVPQKAVVTNLDVKIGQVEVMIDPGGRSTFEVDPKSELAGLQKGDSVTLLIQRRDGREVVTGIVRAAAADTGVQRGVVTNLDMSKGHIEVTLSPGGRRTFEVDPKGLLASVRQGDSVTLLIERRDGREVVTRITR